MTENVFAPGTAEHEAWQRQEAAEGAAVLDELHELLCRYVVFPSPAAADAMVLWTAATHAQHAWEHAPRCAVVSPEKRCGKSRLMDVVEATSRASLVTVNISPAALVRCITPDGPPPTLFIDEADTIFGPRAGDNHEDLRGIVNSGHQRGRPYTRWDITTRQVEHLPTFAMAFLAGIGDLPDTIMDRAVVIRMRRRAPGEKVAPYRTRRDAPNLENLRKRLTGWVDDRLDDLRESVPVMPVEDRAADTWEPLIAVADCAGGHWPARGRNAATLLVNAEQSIDAEASIGARLLRDIRDIFADLPKVGFLASSELVNRLFKLDDAPWKEINRGDPITQRWLALRLGPYGVSSKHNSGRTLRGYHLADFTDAFARYIPPEDVSADDPPGEASPSVQAAEHAF
jgi:hypothetical protein